MVETVGISVGGGERKQSQDCSPSFIPGSLELWLLCSWAPPAGCPSGLLTEEVRMSEPFSTGYSKITPQPRPSPSFAMQSSACLSLTSVWAAQPGGGAEVLSSAVLGTRRMRGASGTDCFSASHSSHLPLPQACQLGIIIPFYRGRK